MIKHRSLSQTILLLMIAGVMLMAVIFGIYFDSFLKKQASEDTKKRMVHGYYQLAANISQFETELKKGVAFIQDDRYLHSSIDLINNYQDKQHYNAILLDEEKKTILKELLDKVKNSLNDSIALYDKNEELVASVVKENNQYRLNFISYENGKPVLYTRLENQQHFDKKPLPQNIQDIFKHVSYYLDKKVINSSVVTYHIIDNIFTMTSHQSIVTQDTGKVKAHIEMSRMLGEKYFLALSQMLDMQVIATGDRYYGEGAFDFNATTESLNKLKILHTDETYYAAAKWNTQSGIIYFVETLNKAPLLKTLFQNRIQMLVILFLITLMVLFALHIFINRRLTEPLALLMGQIRKIEEGDYSLARPVNTNDELEVVSENMNRLAQTIHNRESQLKASKQSMEFLSLHDPLTALPNRRFYMSRLNHAIDNAKRNGTKLAVMFLDIDQFKHLNDTKGHDIGDMLLQKVAERLSRALRSVDTLARIGGDEFNVLIENIEHIEEIESVAQKLMETFKEPFDCKAEEFTRVTSSIGIAVFPEDGMDGTTLIRHADMAMYHAKDHGGGCFRFFSSHLANMVHQKTSRINAMKEALASGDEFGLVYQPKISLHSGKVSGFEALVRWENTLIGPVKVDEFIALAEETNLIIPLGKWIAQKACEDFIRLQHKGFHPDKISINISNKQLYTGNLVDTFEEIIEKTGIDPAFIELEMTESFAASYEEQVLQTLHAFRKMGIELAIDDFGTGYSSMSYLHRLPVSRLKIDKSFIENVPTSEESVAVVNAIMALAKTFNLSVTAEGVETASQLDFLKNAGCDEVQGYYYAKPLKIEEVEQYCMEFSNSVMPL